MIEPICPNIDICRLVNAGDYKIDKEIRKNYLKQYCNSAIDNWDYCKRYIFKQEMNFCPDFILPDTTLSPMEIIDKFDEEETLT
jgi:hypothetical protein